MITNNVSISHFRGCNVGNRLEKKDSNITLKPQLQADTFNGKSLSPATSSLLEQTIDFLGKGRRKRRKKARRAKQNSNNRPPYKKLSPLESLTPGPYGISGEYRNLFKVQLKATPNPNLRAELTRDRTIYDVNRAETRIASISRYLKEEMVGFISPSGDHWFEKALINFIHGSRGKRVRETEFKDAAKELWSLIAKADPYWTSKEFMSYLSSMEQSPARDATIEAIKEITNERKGVVSKISFGYSSAMKDMKRLLDDGCAYTSVPMQRRSRDPYVQVSAEHIFPHSKGGPDNDFNFLLAAAKPNQERGNMPLVLFLKGRNQGE